MSFDKDLAEIRRQTIEALSLSKERVAASFQDLKAESKFDLVWQAYSQAELGIGLARLSYEDELKDEVGTFRDLKHHGNRKSENMSSTSNSRLASCEILLTQAISSFQKERAAESGLCKAREARDILKLLLLEENHSRTRKTERRKQKP